MKVRHSVVLSSLLCVLLVPLAGCGASSIAKQAYYEVRGAKTEVVLISNLAEHTLKRYRSLEFDRATSSAGGKLCPPKLLSYYDSYLAKLPVELSEIYPGGAPGLRISSEILYFHPKGLMSGAMCLARLKIHDTEDQHLVADVMLVTESKSFRQGGRSKIAESSVKGLRKFLRAQAPPDGSFLDDL